MVGTKTPAFPEETSQNSWSCKTPDEPYWLHLPRETVVVPLEMHMETLSPPEPPPAQSVKQHPLTRVHCSAVGFPCTRHPACKSPQALQHRVLSKVNKIRGYAAANTCIHMAPYCKSNKKVSQSPSASSLEPMAQKQPNAGEQLTQSTAEPQLQLLIHLTIITWVRSPLLHHPSGGTVVVCSCACSALTPPPTARVISL